jgi:hypothetical protein
MTENRISLQGAFLAAALFLATIYPGHALLWLPVIGLWAAHRPALRFYREDILLIGFVAGVAVLTFLGFVPQLAGHRPWNPAPLGYVFLIICALIGRWINASTVRWLLVFICFEALVCSIQLALGQPYVFAGQRDAILNSGETEWGSTDLLYFNRAYGLSTNSSVAAQKFMLGVLILFYTAIRRRWMILAGILLAAGLYCTFNRSTLIAVAFFILLKGAGVFLRTPGKRQLQVLATIALTATILTVKWPQVREQFLRGNLDQSVVQESGRLGLLTAATETIAANPILGNFSQRFEVSEYGEWLHLHNSWLQLLADHGIVGLLLIAHAISLIRVWNLPAFLALSLYSVVQFGLFGKISLINIMFYYFMRHRQRSFCPGAVTSSPYISPPAAVAVLPRSII